MARCAMPSPARQRASRRLEALERGNFFVVPLDDQRQWYRYHHLFADVLAAHLLAEQPDLRSDVFIGARACGTSSTARRPRRSATRWPPRISTRAADLVELAVPGTCAGADRRPRCLAG